MYEMKQLTKKFTSFYGKKYERRSEGKVRKERLLLLCIINFLLEYTYSLIFVIVPALKYKYFSTGTTRKVSKRCKIGGKLVLITNRKSYMNFQLIPKSVTLDDLERRYFAEFGKPAFEHITASARKKESSRSPSHLLMSFLLLFREEDVCYVRVYLH